MADSCPPRQPDSSAGGVRSGGVDEKGERKKGEAEEADVCCFRCRQQTHPLRLFNIFTNEPERSSSSVILVRFVASSSVIAPQFMARRKKLSRPWPVAASSKISPTRVARAAFSMKLLRRSLAASRPSRKYVK